MQSTSLTQRRVAVLGAGPIGIETAHALMAAAFEVDMYEQGEVGQSVRDWGHVHLFSPWEINTSALGRAALTDLGMAHPPTAVHPTGSDYVEQYLEPLARHPRLHGRLHTHTTVLQVGRQGVLKTAAIDQASRRDYPFRLFLVDAHGQERIAYADIVIDTTGCYTNPNHLGDGGIPALGERQAATQGRIWYHLPDPCGSDKSHFAGRHTVVVGTGYSAITTLSNLLDLASQAPGTRVTWCTRKTGLPYHRLEADPLPERVRLVELGNGIATGAHADIITLRRGVAVDAITHHDGDLMTLHLLNHTGQAETVADVDTIVAHVGFRPDVALYRELLVHQCYASEGPMQLAASLLASAGTSADCLAQVSPGPATLLSPEPDFFILGAKSYGRGSNFLIRLGLEQIRDVLLLLNESTAVPVSG